MKVLLLVQTKAHDLQNDINTGDSHKVSPAGAPRNNDCSILGSILNLVKLPYDEFADTGLNIVEMLPPLRNLRTSAIVCAATFRTCALRVQGPK